MENSKNYSDKIHIIEVESINKLENIYVGSLVNLLGAVLLVHDKQDQYLIVSSSDPDYQKGELFKTKDEFTKRFFHEYL